MTITPESAAAAMAVLVVRLEEQSRTDARDSAIEHLRAARDHLYLAAAKLEQQREADDPEQ